MGDNKKRVVVDIDAGTDDAFALLILLHAEKIGQIKIEAIICSMGNASVENVCRNVVRLLEILNRTDIPVYKGATEAIIPSETPIKQFHGDDGFADVHHHKEPDLSIISTKPAVIALHEIITNNPKEITMICTGPLTNLALTMKLFVDFAPNVKEIFIMGGNYAATGNITATSEYNFYVDPESAYIVLNNAQSSISIVTWETCLSTKISMEWRFKSLATKKNKFIELLNEAEGKLYKNSKMDDIWYPCDSLIVIAMLYPQEAIVTESRHNATVELHGGKTRGQIVLDHLKEKEPNLHVIETVNEEFVKAILLEAASL